jgi:putative ABC transport system permease protein
MIGGNFFIIMKEIVRNMWRRKFRTFLTVFGIAIGMFAFTVLGSMALRFNAMMDGATKLVTGQITVYPKGGGFGAIAGGNATLPMNTLEKIGEVEGVDAVAATVILPVEEMNLDEIEISFSERATIQASDFDTQFENKNWKTLPMKAGKMVGNGDSPDTVTVGYSIAVDRDLEVGDSMTIRGKDFEVIGIIDKTMTAPDSYVFMDIDPAREMYIDANPFLQSLRQQSQGASFIAPEQLAQLPPGAREQLEKAQDFKLEDISTGAVISWEEGYDPEKISRAVKDEFGDEVTVFSPEKTGKAIESATATFSAIIVGAALIALLVGGFSVINTMVMSISERTREIGIKKALGASRSEIAVEYAIEAGFIGLFGGLIGMLMGLVTIHILNGMVADQGAEIFLVNLPFLANVLVFSFFLGLFAGLLPAIRASRMNVVEALRHV